jgi:hypothetical protein
VPIPGKPDGIVVEPVEDFPHVAVERSIRDRAIESLAYIVCTAAMLDMGMAIAYLVVAIQAIGTPASQRFEGVEVHQHVEKLGLVVEVTTAETAAGLDSYLQSKELGITTSQIASLAPYIGKEYVFVCGWRAEETSDQELARSVRIEFPTKSVFFPLVPSSLYSEPIETSIFVRGWWKPRSESRLSGLDWEQTRGRVSLKSNRERHYLFVSPHDVGGEIQLTRIDLPSDPRSWTRDLWMERAVETRTRFSAFIEGNAILLGFVVISGVGAAIGLFLPR